MPPYFIYIIYTSALASIAFVLVPRKKIRQLSIYGMLLGAFFDIVAIFVFRFLGIGEYTNIGPLGLLYVPFFPPIAWTIYFIIYFYLLPKNKPWIYFYIIMAAGYSTMFSNVLQNLGILKWYYGSIIIPFFIYLIWYSLATWVYYLLVFSGEIKHIMRPVIDKGKNESLFSRINNPGFRTLFISRRKLK